MAGKENLFSLIGEAVFNRLNSGGGARRLAGPVDPGRVYPMTERQQIDRQSGMAWNRSGPNLPVGVGTLNSRSESERDYAGGKFGGDNSLAPAFMERGVPGQIELSPFRNHLLYQEVIAEMEAMEAARRGEPYAPRMVASGGGLYGQPYGDVPTYVQNNALGTWRR